MDIIDEIKELRIRAKEAELWRERYDKAVSKIKEAVSLLAEFQEIKIKIANSNHVEKITSGIKKVADAIYVKMKADDSLQYDRSKIAGELRANNLMDSQTNISLVAVALQKMPDIKFRRDGYLKILFYENLKESLDADQDSIKIEKTSFMG